MVDDPGHRVTDFDEAYAGVPPWEIGRPQPLFAALADAGELRGRVLDAGCGTGEHALLAASAGLDANGVDTSPRAIELARDKAAARGLRARFVVGDARELGASGERFDTVLDCGLFHVFDDADRARYVAALGEVVPPGGAYLMACFSDRQPGDWGPRRVTEAEIRAAFASGWSLRSVEAASFELSSGPGVVDAWLVRAARV